MAAASRFSGIFRGQPAVLSGSSRAASSPRGVLLALGEGSCPIEALPVAPHLVTRFDEAREQFCIRGKSWACAVVEASFDRGRGLDLVHFIRARRPLLPILLFAPYPGREVLSVAYADDVQLLTSGCTGEEVSAFVCAASAQERPTLQKLEVRLQRLAEEHHLTPNELRVATAITRGLRRSELADAFDVTANTIKSQTRSVLKKTGYKSLSELARGVLSDLFVPRPWDVASPGEEQRKESVSIAM